MADGVDTTAAAAPRAVANHATFTGTDAPGRVAGAGRDDMSYAEAVAWLVQQRRGGRPRDPAVAAALLDSLRAPLPPLALHVVGTNGKGTVAHLLSAMAQAAGLRAGRFTSPHVEDLRERVAVNGELVAPEEVVAFVAAARARKATGIGFFEWTLGLAADVFHRAGVELAVIEAGVGARRDATLAWPNVAGTVLTNVDLDHVETLGPTLLDIARDKAAVARPGVPLVTGARGEALEVILEVANEVGAPVWAVSPDHPLAAWPAGGPAIGASWPPTRVEDAGLALALGRVLGWPEAALVSGLASPPPPARFERFQLVVDDRGVEVVLDGAHDPSATARLAAALPAGFVLLFGSLARKRRLDALAPLRARAAEVWLTSAEPGEEPPPPPSCGGPPVRSEARLEDALAGAAAAAAARGARLVVAGSLHLAGHARPWLRRRDVGRDAAGAMLAGRWDASASSA